MEQQPCLLLENVQKGPNSDCSSITFVDDTKSENRIIPVTKEELENILKSNQSLKSSAAAACNPINNELEENEKSFKDDANSEASFLSEHKDENVISVTIKSGGHPRIQMYNSKNLAEVDEVGPADGCCLKEGYRLGKEIGEGAYSCVRAAEVLQQKIESDRKIARLVQKNKHKWVAVKILNKNKAPSDYTTKFIGREIQALHRIRGHENVVEIYDVFETSEYLFIITELCQKGDLFHYINACADVGHTGLPEDQARQFFIQICNGMQYCHQRGVVHRDFKCENVLISDDEKNVKITDFGFACTVPNKRLMLSTPCGSYSYAAPEVLFGKSYDPFVSDVWSLGVVLFCMLNGTTPYGHVQLSLLEEYMGAQRLQFQKISLEAKHLLRQLLSYEPRKRPRFAEILKSPFVTRQKTHFVEKLCTPVVEDRSHLVDFVSRFNVPTTPNFSTDHRQCINFSRICFSNGSETVSLKSRQPNRERDRHIHLIPILRRTRMSVIEFKERMGLKINQSQPMAQILKNIISGTNAAGLSGEGTTDSMKPIPDLPANMSTQQGDTNQPMVEYLAEMWIDVDRNQGTVVSTQDSSQENGCHPVNATQAGVVNGTVGALSDLTKTQPGPDSSHVGKAGMNPLLQEELGVDRNDAQPYLQPSQPPARESKVVDGGNQATLLDDVQLNEDARTESSFCTCTNPDTASTYTVHVPQPDEPPLESPPPTPQARWPEFPPDRYGYPRGESRVATTTPVDQEWSKSPTPVNRLSRLHSTRYSEMDRYSLTIAERAKLLNDKADRLLSRSKNGIPYRHASSVPKHVQRFNIEKVATKVQSFTLRKPLTNINKTKPNLAANNCKVFPPKQSQWINSKASPGQQRTNVYQRSEKSTLNRPTEERMVIYRERQGAISSQCLRDQPKACEKFVNSTIKEKIYYLDDGDLEASDDASEDHGEPFDADVAKKPQMDQVARAIGSKSKECQSAPTTRTCEQRLGPLKDSALEASYSQSKLETRPPSAELAKQISGDSIPTHSSDSDDELRKIALADDNCEQSPTKSPENQQAVSVKYETTSQALAERLSYLASKKSDLESCSPVPQSPDDPIYERHARTPVKERPMSRAITPDIKKTKGLFMRRLVNEPEQRHSESLVYGERRGGYKFLRKGTYIRASHLKSEVKKLIKGTIEDRENKSLPVLQINKSMINKIDRSSVKKVFPRTPMSPQKSINRKTKSPFPNPLTDPKLWQELPDTVQLRDKVRSTPTIACPLLPQKSSYIADPCKRPYRIRMSETSTCSTNQLPKPGKGLFPPVTNLVFADSN